MTEKIIQNYIQQKLPHVLERIIDSLEEFTKRTWGIDDEDDTKTVKNFIEFHKAMKIGLGNIEPLLKLLKDQNVTPSTFAETEKIRKLLGQAKAEVIQHLENNPID